MLLALILLVLGVISGLLRGGRLDNITGVRFRLPWLVFLGLALQVGAEALAAMFPGIQRGLTGPIVLMISYGFVVAFVALNVRYPGTILIGAGLLLNLTVILANGAMPVSLSAVREAGGRLPHLQNEVKHRVMGPGTRLGLLGDIIPLPPLGVVSLGDVVLGAGVFLMVDRLVTSSPDPPPEPGDAEAKGRAGHRRSGPPDPPQPPAATTEPPGGRDHLTSKD